MWAWFEANVTSSLCNCFLLVFIFQIDCVASSEANSWSRREPKWFDVRFDGSLHYQVFLSRYETGVPLVGDTVVALAHETKVDPCTGEYSSNLKFTGLETWVVYERDGLVWMSPSGLLVRLSLDEVNGTYSSGRSGYYATVDDLFVVRLETPYGLSYLYRGGQIRSLVSRASDVNLEFEASMGRIRKVVQVPSGEALLWVNYDGRNKPISIRTKGCEIVANRLNNELKSVSVDDGRGQVAVCFEYTDGLLSGVEYSDGRSSSVAWSVDPMGGVSYEQSRPLVSRVRVERFDQSFYSTILNSRGVKITRSKAGQSKSILINPLKRIKVNAVNVNEN